MESIKTYIEGVKTYKAVLLAVVGLGVVVAGSYVYMKDRPVEKEREAVVNSTVHMLEGQVMRMHEGENKLVYSMDIPETATSALALDGALIKVTDNGTPFVSMYMSYEGGRGYASTDYINNVIAPKVSVLTTVGTTTIGGTTWTVAQTANTEWHVGQVGDGQWLMIVEAKRSSHDAIVKMLESLTTK